MDLGLYNKKSEPRGEHGTLIGNWCEERALQATTGFARTDDLALEKKALNVTHDRIVSHSHHADSGKNRDERVSITKSTYVAHPNDAFPVKLFNQTGSHGLFDEGQVTLPARRRDMASQISFGNDTSPWTSTASTSFLTATVKKPSEPAQRQPRSPFTPKPFPNNLSGGEAAHKLDRPYAVASASAAQQP